MEKTIEKKTEEKKVYPSQVIEELNKMIYDNDETEIETFVSCIKENVGGNIKKITKEFLLPLVVEFNKTKEELNDQIGAAFASGMFLNEEPFIPEYIGFTQQMIENENGSIRMYQKDDFIIMRNTFETLEKGKDKWSVTKNVGKEEESTTEVYTFANMLEAVLVLKAKGLDVSILDVVSSKY